MKVYKATDRNMCCRGYQFKQGIEAVEESAELCKSGFHACEAPLDVLAYYAPGEGSRYFEAELEDVNNERRSDDSKVVGKKITLGAEIGIPGLVKAHFEYTKSKCKKEKTGGDGSALTGGYGSALTGGDRSALRSGKNSKFKGGMWAIFACDILDKNDEIIGVKTAVVDGVLIKPDTWYAIENGEFKEVKDNG